MNFEKTANGNLRIFVENDADKEMLQEILDAQGGDDRAFMCELLERTGWFGNGRLYSVEPEQVGGLTEAPILTDEMSFEDNGDTKVAGTVWWYPHCATC